MKTNLSPALGSLDWGSLRNMNPVSENWGFDRGQPVGRYYVEQFLERHSEHIKGKCIEVMNADYCKRFGNDRTSQIDVIDINPNNKQATIIGDLTDPNTLGEKIYDCFILTQTLPVIFDSRAVLKNCYAAIKPGGVLLVTVPALCRYSPHPEDYWRFTDKSLSELIRKSTACSNWQVSSFGNLVASIGFLIGVASSELTPEELQFYDPRFPITITALLRKT